MSAKHSYYIEAGTSGGWARFGGEFSLSEARGYTWCHRSAPGPRLAVRIVRSDGRVMDESGALEDVSLGMIAGWPSPQQYVEAAARALASAVRAARTLHGGGWGENDSDAALERCREALAGAEVAS